MRRMIRYIPLVAVAFTFAACGEQSSSPTAAMPEIRRDGGGLGVGGSATPGGPTTTPTDPTNTTTAAEADTTYRGGGLGVGGS